MSQSFYLVGQENNIGFILGLNKSVFQNEYNLQHSTMKIYGGNSLQYGLFYERTFKNNNAVNINFQFAQPTVIFTQKIDDEFVDLQIVIKEKINNIRFGIQYAQNIASYKDYSLGANLGMGYSRNTFAVFSASDDISLNAADSITYEYIVNDNLGTRIFTPDVLAGIYISKEKFLFFRKAKLNLSINYQFLNLMNTPSNYTLRYQYNAEPEVVHIAQWKGRFYSIVTGFQFYIK